MAEPGKDGVVNPITAITSDEAGICRWDVDILHGPTNAALGQCFYRGSTQLHDFLVAWKMTEKRALVKRDLRLDKCNLL